MVKGFLDRVVSVQKPFSFGVIMAPRRKNFVEEGSRYGRLVVLREEKKPSDPHHHYYLCQCDCGNTKLIRDRSLCSGETKSCGCLWTDTLNEYQRNNSKNSALPIGYRVGILTVIEDLGVIPIASSREHCYKCRCDCGNEIIARQFCLKKGTVNSCGCERYTKNIKVRQESCRQKREYPDWLSSMLVYDEEKQGLENKEYIYEKELHFKCSKCGTIFKKQIAYVMRLNKNRKKPIALCLDCSNHRSAFEEEVYQYVVSLIPNLKIKTNIWSILRDENRHYEIDIYIPSLKIAIECNGDYFHSEQNAKLEKFHMNKFLLAEKSGIHLIQIFESSWKSNQEEIKNYLRDLFCTTYKIYARKCVIQQPTLEQVKSFYNINHLQGYSNHCNINYSLLFNNEVVAMMSFCRVGLHNRNKSDGYYELSRYAVKSGYTVIGGPSKLLCYFEKNFNPKFLLSYSDNDYFTGNMYSQLGFVFDGIPRPRYHWFMRDQTVRTRESCQLRHLLKQYPELYEKAQHVDGNKETFIMTALKAVKVWHSGNKRWVKKYN